jgi:hypothetical protein
VGSEWMARADMESASPKRQSIGAAGMVLPERLSASVGVGVTLGAMMSDQSRRKTRWGIDLLEGVVAQTA